MTSLQDPESRPAATTEREELVRLLLEAYWLEIETSMNYLANSASLDENDHLHDEVAECLREDAAEGFSRAQLLVAQLRGLGANVPGSLDFPATQEFLQPGATNANVCLVLRGAIEAERETIDRYSAILTLTQRFHSGTSDLAEAILRERQTSRRLFETYLRNVDGVGDLTGTGLAHAD